MRRGILPIAVSLAGIAAAQVVVKQQGYIPFGQAPIDYQSEKLDDPVARLQRRLARGEAKLDFEPRHGYLRSVLRTLGIPESSQTLVFSKTSFQYPKISPEHPRALYFNDDVYVGQVHDGGALEFVSFDPMQGAIFYVLDEPQAKHPRFERAINDCVQCHVGGPTKNVPGVMLRSVTTNPSGTQKGGTPSFVTGHESPTAERWGGWFVTGSAGNQQHMGTAVGDLDLSAYVTKTSDIVAHLVLAHQTQMHNLITQTNYQTRLAQHAGAKAASRQWETPAEALVRYLLFANEAPLAAPVHGDSPYAREFAAKGPRDPQGRSLRDFDLQRRIFRYPCSYLIYSEAFDAIPEPAKSYIWRRLLEVLGGRDQSSDFASLTTTDRQAVLEILATTKPNLPGEWKQHLERAQKGEER
jgi:hypothetical protein